MAVTVVIAVFLSVFGAGSGEFDAVEKVAPDSALVVLEGMDRGSMSPRRGAEYDYLHALSFYRSYYFLTPAEEEALLSACNWFEENGPLSSRVAAWELLGTARTAAHQYTGGLAALMKARQAALEQEKRRSRTGALLLLIIGVLSTLVLYFYALKMQAQKRLAEEREENERLLSAAEDLRRRLSARKAGNSALDRLCEQYYIHEGTDNLQPKILREVRSIIESYRSDSRERRELEAALDSDGTITRLRETFPKWKEEDFSLYIFTAAGFSTTTIAALLEKDKPYIYNRLYRIKERIKASPDAEFFLSKL
ncbi:MAG: hypothetical protein IKR69_05495 [Bacteroidales bacterium]|nr:hypothetical protein [Bacteroidales bacterium]